MEDFNEYVKNNKKSSTTDTSQMNLFNLVNSLASKFNGKNQNELLKAIYEEAEKGKRNGTLTNKEIDNFVEVLSPFLDDKKRKILDKVVRELKKI